MATRMLQRRGTATQWANANPILGSGEIGFETDTGQFKIGDNSTNWDDLPYFKNIEDLGGNLDDYILLTQKGAANGVATLDGSNLIPDAQIPNAIARTTDVSNLISGAIEDLIGTAPLALDTLQEIANAINNDQTYFFTVANNINNALDAANEYTDNSISNLSAEVTDQIELLGNTVANNLANAVLGLQDEIGNAITSAEAYADDVAAFALGNAQGYTDGEVDILSNSISNALSNAHAYTDDAVSNHELDTLNVHGISNTATLVTLTDLSNHESDTSNVHGITNTLALVLTSDSRLSDERTPSNNSVTNAKLADNAVDTAEIANAAVTNAKLANNAVDTAQIANNAVTNAKLAGSIDQSKITNLVTDLGNKQDKVSGVSDTEIGYLDGVTSGIQTQLDAKLDKSGGTMTGAITLSGAPTSDLHAATKLYVDNVTVGINFHAAVHAATTAALSATYNNNTNGVGATLTASGGQQNTVLVIDGQTMAVGERVLVKDQTTQTQNGIYEVTNAGKENPGGNNWVLTRATDSDNNPSGEIKNGDFCLVMTGTTNSSYGYINNSTANPIVLGTDNITYTAFNAAKAIAAGTGLSEPTPGTLAIDTATTVDVSTAQTLTNKTINGSNNTITNVSLTAGVTGTLPAANGGTGVTSLGAGVATFLSTPTAVNLAAMVTDETGTGSLVFANGATLIAPTLGAANATSITFSDGTQSMQGVPSLTPIIQKTASYTLSALTERDDLIEMDSVSATTLTIPLNSAVAFPVGTSIDILQTNTGQVTIAGDAGVTVNATPGLKLRTRWSSCTLFKRATNTWVVYGDLTA